MCTAASSTTSITSSARATMKLAGGLPGRALKVARMENEVS
jgi:hypothetical protein